MTWMCSLECAPLRYGYKGQHLCQQQVSTSHFICASTNSLYYALGVTLLAAVRCHIFQDCRRSRTRTPLLCLSDCHACGQRLNKTVGWKKIFWYHVLRTSSTLWETCMEKNEEQSVSRYIVVICYFSDHILNTSVRSRFGEKDISPTVEIYRK